jgi:ribonuclease HI
MIEQPQLNILQYNVRKAKDTVMATLLRDPRVIEYDVLAIQEPWKNPFMSTTHHPAKDIFHLCYPDVDEEKGPARVCFFVNKRLDQSAWQFEQYTRDMCTLKIRTGERDTPASELIIHNVYNAPQNTAGRGSTIPLLKAQLEKHIPEEQIALGDFNLHHRFWGGSRVQREEQEAKDLLEIMENLDMTSMLEPGTITYEEGDGRSTIDLCWTTLGMVDRVIKSTVDRDMDHDSDHLPISILLDVRVNLMETKLKRRWKNLDTEKFCEVLRHSLPPRRRPRTKAALDKYTRELVDAITRAADEVLPPKRHSPKAREGWDNTCTEALAETKRLRRVYTRRPTTATWELYREARNRKTRVIRKALRQAHRDRVELAARSPESLWRIAKWARNRENQPPSVTPTIICPNTGEEAVRPEEKANMLRDTFFPKPPEADLSDMENAEYHDQISMPDITEKEVLDAVQAAAPLKAPGPDGIPNKVLQAASSILVGHLATVMNQSLKLRYCPAHFRNSTTVVLRKQGKDNYTTPKAYRPIALLNTIGKVMDAIIARRLSYLVERFHVIPRLHMGGRKLRSVEHALHNVVQRVYEAWNTGQGQVLSLLLLDVSGAFDNVSHKRLLHNLRKRRVDERIVRWIASFLSDRRTKIAIDGYESEEYNIETGVPQGSPLSPILYILYNADLIECCNSDETEATGYIDDGAIFACGNTTEDTCSKLERALEKAGRWAATHASKFAPEKFQLVHFTRARTRVDAKRPLDTAWGKIEPKTTCKYLGVTLDSKLKWKEHVQEIRRKTTNTVNALSCLGSSTWGIRLADIRKIYRGVALPQMMYACSLWSNPGGSTDTYTDATLNTLKAIQARAARAICGAFKATSRPALDVETHLLPIEHQIWKHNTEAVGRMLTSDGLPELSGLAEECSRVGQQKKVTHKSPLSSIIHRLRADGAIDLSDREKIAPFVAPPWWQGATIHIAPNDDEARAQHDRIAANKDNICMYTDGSCIQGHTGAAAVWPARRRTESAYMGLDTTSTVYAAELQGICLALAMIQADMRRGNRHKHLHIFADNQAAIRSVVRPDGRSGAYIVRQIVQKIDQLRTTGVTIDIHWICAHEGVEGNEAADLAAKEATGWRMGDTRGPRAEPPPQLHPLRTTLKTWSRKTANLRWQASWAIESKGKAVRRHTPVPTKKVLQLHADLSKAESALLVQMRTEKIGLKDFLFNHRVPGFHNARCHCGERRQTVAHVLLSCHHYKELRRQELGHLPGRSNLRAILSTRKLAIKAIRLMEQTRVSADAETNNA